MTRTRVLIAAAALVGVLAPTAPASADAVPFADPDAHGSIGFCDSSGNEIKSGNTGDAPFAAYAVSSVPAPTGYDVTKGGRTALYVYQPIKYVDPGDWSGKQMGAASIFSNSAHPKSAQTAIDPALVDFVSVFPPHWNGLVQFRMYFSAPYQGPYTNSYPAAVVHVSGDRWTLVQGGGVPCATGTSVSVETRALPKSVLNHATPRSTPGVTAPPGDNRSAATSGSTPSAGASSTGSTVPGEVEVSPAAHSAESGGGSGAPWWIALVVGAVAAVGAAAGVVVRRRRRTA